MIINAAQVGIALLVDAATLLAEVRSVDGGGADRVGEARALAGGEDAC